MKKYAIKQFAKHKCAVCDFECLCVTNNKLQFNFPLTCDSCGVKIFFKNLEIILIQKIDITEISKIMAFFKFKLKNWAIIKE